MDTMIWLAEQKVHYSSLMLHRNMNSDNERKKRQVVEKQIKKKFQTHSTRK